MSLIKRILDYIVQFARHKNTGNKSSKESTGSFSAIEFEYVKLTQIENGRYLQFKRILFRLFPFKLLLNYFSLKRSRLWLVSILSIVIFYFDGSQQNTELIPPKNTPSTVKNILLILSSGDSLYLPADRKTLAMEHNKLRLGDSTVFIFPGNTMDEGFNTLQVPRGVLFDLVLPDQSVVTLMPATIFRFPTLFNNSERRVELMGEASLEVTRNVNKPFIVRVNSSLGVKKDVEVKVLGTKFNVIAYENEGQITTALLEGKVQVNTSEKNVVLTHGQMAVITKHEKVTSSGNVQVAAVNARAKGFFSFKGKPLKELVRQVERIYDVRVQIVQSAGMEVQFNGSISKNVPLSDFCTSMNKHSPCVFSLVSDSLLVVKAKSR